MTKYTSDLVVTVRKFTRQLDGQDVIIGNADTTSFLAVPPEAVEMLDYLAAGKNVGEATDFYLQKYGEALDADDFLGIMEAKGFIVAAETGSHSPPAASHRSPPIRYHFSSIPQSVAAFVYSPLTLVVYLSVTLLAVSAMVIDKRLVPRATDFVFPDHRVLSAAVFIGIAMATIFLHELSHVIAARAQGINSRLAIGNRMWFVVAEADLTALWAVPKRRRYVPLLAGMITDIVSGALLVLALFARDDGWISLSDFTVRLLRALVLSYCLRIVWQFYVFVRTDIYFVIASYFDCKNLLKDTENFLRKFISQVFPSVRVVDQSNIPASELRIIRLYSIVWVIGRALAFYVLIAVTIPVAFSYIRNLAHAFQAGSSTGVYNFVDSLLFSGFFLISTATGMFLWIRGMARRQRA